MKIDVKHLAKLAHLRVSAEQEEMYAAQMQDILEMVESCPSLKARTAWLIPIIR